MRKLELCIMYDGAVFMVDFYIDDFSTCIVYLHEIWQELSLRNVALVAN